MNLGSAIGGLGVYENAMHSDMLSHNNLIHPSVEVELSELIKLSPRKSRHLKELLMRKIGIVEKKLLNAWLPLIRTNYIFIDRLMIAHFLKFFKDVMAKKLTQLERRMSLCEKMLYHSMS